MEFLVFPISCSKYLMHRFKPYGMIISRWSISSNEVRVMNQEMELRFHSERIQSVDNVIKVYNQGMQTSKPHCANDKCHNNIRNVLANMKQSNAFKIFSIICSDKNWPRIMGNNLGRHSFSDAVPGMLWFIR